MEKVKKFRKSIRDVVIKQLNPEELLEYWKYPSEENNPAKYTQQVDRTKYLVELINMVDKEFYPSDKRLKILELGCNVGRNLFHIEGNICCDLSAIEINEYAVKLGKKVYRGLSNVKFYVGNVETEIRKIPKQNIIISMAVLQHIHKSKIKRLCKDISERTEILVLIENETYKSERHNKNNYKKIFERYGFKEIYYNFSMSRYGFIQKGFLTRILRKE